MPPSAPSPLFSPPYALRDPRTLRGCERALFERVFEICFSFFSVVSGEGRVSGAICAAICVGVYMQISVCGWMETLFLFYSSLL
jgi:hypothetical protein